MNWIDYRSKRESLDLLGTIACACANLGGSQSRALYDLVKTEDYLNLIDTPVDYTGSDLRDMIMARQILGLFTKYPYLPLPYDRRLEAIKKFREAEALCLLTNRRLREYRRDPALCSGPTHSIFYRASVIIGNILGSVPSLEELQFAFGPGANTNVKGIIACPRVKLSATLMCSGELAPVVGSFLSEVPAWTQLHSYSESNDSYNVEVTLSHGKVMFVPKNAKTDRSIVVEPLLNSFFQKGVGSYIRSRLLKRSGVDLKDQTLNQRLACKGSIDGSLATVDLSMASDCLSVELVRELLPVDWTLFLERLRTGTAEFVNEHGDKEIIRLEKFSSMGNGFTFELESLIFYSLAKAVCVHLGLPSDEVSVFGDDIIIPTLAFSCLRDTLLTAGFSINVEKSFSDGPFRESCGSDFVSGFDIRPFYAKKRINEAQLYLMHNFFFRNGEFELARLVRSMCNPTLMLTGPDGYGDGHLIGDYNLRVNRSHRRSGWAGGYFDTYSLEPAEFKKPQIGDSVLPVYSVYTRSGSDSPTNPNAVRGSKGYAKMSIYTLRSGIILK